MGKPLHETRQELLLKEKRIMYWEKYRSIPTVYDLINEGKVKA
jgi:hypothetical protein